MNEKLRRQDDKKIDELANMVALHLQDSTAVRKELNTKIDNNEKNHSDDIKDVKDSLKLILEQTTKHNGRMTKVEAWKNVMIGGLAVLTVIVLPLLGWALTQLVNVDSRVQAGTRTAIEAYNLTLKDIK